MILNKYLNYPWSHREQFVKYFFIGVSGTILDILTLWILKEFFGLLPVIAVVVNQIFMLLYIFFLNKKFSFQTKGDTRKQMVRFFILAGANYLFAISWMWLWSQYFGYNYVLVRICNIALAVAWNFLLYREWVYKVRNDQVPMTNDQNL